MKAHLVGRLADGTVFEDTDVEFVTDEGEPPVLRLITCAVSACGLPVTPVYSQEHTAASMCCGLQAQCLDTGMYWCSRL